MSRVCSCIASALWLGDEPARATGFIRPVLLTARGRKKLDPLQAKPLRRGVADPGGLVQTK